MVDLNSQWLVIAVALQDIHNMTVYSVCADDAKSAKELAVDYGGLVPDKCIIKCVHVGGLASGILDVKQLL